MFSILPPLIAPHKRGICLESRLSGMGDEYVEQHIRSFVIMFVDAHVRLTACLFSPIIM